MEELFFKNIAPILTFIAKLLASLAALSPLIIFFGRKFLGHYFSKNIEKYKHDLNLQKEVLTHDLQKQVLQFQTSIEKVSSIYQQLFEKIMVADGAVSALPAFGGRYGNSFENWGIPEFEKALDDHKATSVQKEKVLNAIISNRKTGEDIFKKEWEFLIGLNAAESLKTARNFYWTQKIYLSISICEIVYELFNKLSQKHDDNESPKEADGNTYFQRNEDITALIEKLENQMRLEMRGT